jgi:hypothetical protein
VISLRPSLYLRPMYILSTVSGSIRPFFSLTLEKACLHRQLHRQQPPGPVQAVQEFLQYRAQAGPFSADQIVWQLVGPDQDPPIFWTAIREFTPHLARIATWLLRTPCNSVPSERSFSAQNLIHNKTRNRLTPEKTNKLMFIYINRRVLDRAGAAGAAGRQPIRWEDLNEEQLLELEDELLANGALLNLENLWEEGLEEIPEV